jgi:hypothetical protein
MKISFEQALEIWRQALLENAKTVELGTERFPVRRTPKRGLRQVDFEFDGNTPGWSEFVTGETMLALHPASQEKPCWGHRVGLHGAGC